MKRSPRSFVVEVRRQRRPPDETAPSWAEEALKSERRVSVDRPTRAAERMAAPTTPVPAASVAARPTGRILPSLIEAPPVEVVAAAAKPAPVKTRAPRRPRRPAAPIPPPIAFVEPVAIVLTRPPVAELAKEPARPGGSARHRRILARYVFGGDLKPGERWKRRARGEKP